jgi:nucleotide-binding universal stress UspA family protein
MTTILCATRGGEASYRTQDKAIALAKEKNADLLFLYVIDLQFLDMTAAPIVVDVEDEVHDMGEFLLLMAKERAAKQGVSAQTVCQKGKVRKEIIKAVRKYEASFVVLGRPAGDDGDKSAFQLAGLQAFASKIKAATGATVLIV